MAPPGTPAVRPTAGGRGGEGGRGGGEGGGEGGGGGGGASKTNSHYQNTLHKYACGLRLVFECVTTSWIIIQLSEKSRLITIHNHVQITNT